MNKKRTYQVPSIHVVRLNAVSFLLAGSLNATYMSSPRQTLMEGTEGSGDDYEAGDN